MQKLSAEELLENVRLWYHNPKLGRESEAELLSRLALVENLKCCGNCGYKKTSGCENWYPKENGMFNDYCESWEPDNLTREDRG